MINIYEAVVILFLHWIFDFVLQTDEQGKNKSSDFNVLLEHVFLYSWFWCIPLIIYAIMKQGSGILVLFIPITFICHGIIDYCTSRVGKRLLQKAELTKNHHNFFVNIGFDQWLHQAQLLITFYLLT